MNEILRAAILLAGLAFWCAVIFYLGRLYERAKWEKKESDVESDVEEEENDEE